CIILDPRRTRRKQQHGGAWQHTVLPGLGGAVVYVDQEPACYSAEDQEEDQGPRVTVAGTGSFQEIKSTRRCMITSAVFKKKWQASSD
ncbi:hypothetical protein SKAU_G00330230, partial [Synaphobranchus kaupii]